LATLTVIDGAGVSRETKVAGSGTTGDPYVPSVNVDTLSPGTAAASLGKAEDAAHTSGDTGVLALAVRNDAGTALAGTTLDYIPLSTDSTGALRTTGGGGGGTVDTELPAAAALSDAASNPTTPLVGACLLYWNGASWDRVRAAGIGKDLNAVAGGSIVTVWTPTSGKRVRLMSGSISVSAACSVLFEDNAAGTTVYRTPKLLADTPYSFDLGGGYLLSAANNVLKLTTSAAANVTGTLRGTEE